MTPCCGNCKHASKAPDSNWLLVCAFPLPKLPWWLDIQVPLSRFRHTRETDGADCPTFAAKGAEMTPGQNEINAKIDRLLHDAERADSGAKFARQIGHTGPAREMERKCEMLINEARILYAANPGATWPDEEDCEWKPK